MNGDPRVKATEGTSSTDDHAFHSSLAGSSRDDIARLLGCIATSGSFDDRREVSHFVTVTIEVDVAV